MLVRRPPERMACEERASQTVMFCSSAWHVSLDRRNHALLLRAFAKVPPSNPDAHLVLVGDGRVAGTARRPSKGFGLGSQVRFLGLRTDIQTC